MNTLEKPLLSGQTLEDFKKIIEEIEPYLPPPTRTREPKPQPYQPSDTILQKRRRKY